MKPLVRQFFFSGSLLLRFQMLIYKTRNCVICRGRIVFLIQWNCWVWKYLLWVDIRNAYKVSLVTDASKSPLGRPSGNQKCNIDLNQGTTSWLSGWGQLGWIRVRGQWRRAVECSVFLMVTLTKVTSVTCRTACWIGFQWKRIAMYNKFYTFHTVHYNIPLKETNQHNAQLNIYYFTSLHLHVSVSVDHLQGAWNPYLTVTWHTHYYPGQF
jgi:hypothetical protein